MEHLTHTPVAEAQKQAALLKFAADSADIVTSLTTNWTTRKVNTLINQLTSALYDAYELGRSHERELNKL